MNQSVFESIKMSVTLNTSLSTNNIYNRNTSKKNIPCKNYLNPAKQISFGLKTTYKLQETCFSMLVESVKRIRCGLFPPGQKINGKIYNQLMKKLEGHSAIAANCAEDSSRTIFKTGRSKELKNKYFELIHERKTPNGILYDNPNNQIKEVYRETVIILNKKAQSAEKTKYNQALIPVIEDNNIVQEKEVLSDQLYKYLGAQKAAKLAEKRIDRFLNPEKYGSKIKLLDYKTDKRPFLWQLNKIKHKLINFRKSFAEALRLFPYLDSRK